MIVSQNRWISAVLAVSGLVLLGGCQSPDQSSVVNKISAQTEAPGQTGLNWNGKVFGLTIDDLNGDGTKDLVAIDHGKNEAHVFLQAPKQVWGPPNIYTGVGFHPGNMLTWPGEPKRLILAAEGDNAIRSLVSDAMSGLQVESNLREIAPRYIKRFRWPGWGESLVVSPYAHGYIVLLKNYDPGTGKAEERVVVPLSSKEHSILAAERITVADIDGDGVDELLTVVSITNQVFQIKYPGTKGRHVPKVKEVYSNKFWGAANEAQAIDIDRDGDVDLLVPDEIGPAPRGVINLLLNQGKGKFREGTPIPFSKPDGIQELRVARDQDGLDYLFAAGIGGLSLYQVPEVWKDGDPLPMLSLGWSSSDYTRELQFEDIDGDGWLDVALGRVFSASPVWIAYGPLWERFRALAEAGFSLR